MQKHPCMSDHIRSALIYSTIIHNIVYPGYVCSMLMFHLNVHLPLHKMKGKWEKSCAFHLMNTRGQCFIFHVQYQNDWQSLWQPSGYCFHSFLSFIWLLAIVLIIIINKGLLLLWVLFLCINWERMLMQSNVFLNPWSVCNEEW